MVDGGGLENRCTRKGTGGSNPSLSANLRKATVVVRVESPAQSGDYVAEIDLGHEYVSGFAPHGVQPVPVRFHAGD